MVSGEFSGFGAVDLTKEDIWRLYCIQQWGTTGTRLYGEASAETSMWWSCRNGRLGPAWLLDHPQVLFFPLSVSVVKICSTQQSCDQSLLFLLQSPSTGNETAGQLKQLNPLRDCQRLCPLCVGFQLVRRKEKSLCVGACKHPRWEPWRCLALCEKTPAVLCYNQGHVLSTALQSFSSRTLWINYASVILSDKNTFMIGL